jgi:hypothetical protein
MVDQAKVWQSAGVAAEVRGPDAAGCGFHLWLTLGAVGVAAITYPRRSCTAWIPVGKNIRRNTTY